MQDFTTDYEHLFQLDNLTKLNLTLASPLDQKAHISWCLSSMFNMLLSLKLILQIIADNSGDSKIRNIRLPFRKDKMGDLGQHWVSPDSLTSVKGKTMEKIPHKADKGK